MGWPNEKEIYTARFRHAEMKGNEVVRAVHEAACMKLQCETATAPLVYRMEPGDYFRCHHDGYLGNCGYTYFLNEGWKWDWGGLLNFISPDGEQSEPIFPKSGRILFRDEMESPPHFVSKVEPWALNPQYLIIGFGNR